MVALFIVAFAMAFSVLMSHDPGFTDIPNSLLTTFVMMTGEVDFRDTFLGYAASAGFNFLQRLLLVVFLILVTIGITNLLTGLAVGDTAEIMERSREENLLRKVRIIKIISTLNYVGDLCEIKIYCFYLENIFRV